MDRRQFGKLVVGAGAATAAASEGSDALAQSQGAQSGTQSVMQRIKLPSPSRAPRGFQTANMRAGKTRLRA
jgi:hypothetical protein